MEQPTPSGREMDILKVLWELGPASVRNVCRRMCPNHKLAFNTVQTLLGSWTKKVWSLTRGWAASSSTRPATAASGPPRGFCSHVFDGAIDQLMLSMLSTANPNSEELRQLEKIVADARRRKQRQAERKKEP